MNTPEYRSDIYFRIDESCIDLSFRDNAAMIEDLASFIDSVGIEAIASVSVSSYASPDGPYRKNMNLAERRAESIRAMIGKLMPECIPLVTIEDCGESWKRFAVLVCCDTVLSSNQRQKVLDIIDSDLPFDVREGRIRGLDSYEYIRDRIWSRLRYSEVTVHYSVETPCDTLPALGKPEAVLAAKAFAQDTLPLSYHTLPLASSFLSEREVFYLRTNLLVPLSNVGVEYSINDHWSVGADWYFPWVFRNPDHRNCFQILGGGIEGRYWFGNGRTAADRLEGHSVGLGLSGGYYDFERNFTGRQGEFVNIGADYLYSLPVLDDKLHIEFTVGLGYIYSPMRPYDVFEPGGKAFKRGYTERFHWVGPTKAGVSLVVPITAKRRGEK